MSEPASAWSVSSTARSAPSASAFCSGRCACSRPMQSATISPTSCPASRSLIASSRPWTSNGFSSLSPDRSSRFVDGSMRFALVALGTSLTQTAMFTLSPCLVWSWLLPDERRGALLHERAQALAGVVRGENERVQVGLVHQVAADVAVQRPVRGLLGVVQGDRALRGHLLGHLHGPRHQLGDRIDVLDEPAFERLGSVHH